MTEPERDQIIDQIELAEMALGTALRHLQTLRTSISIIQSQGKGFDADTRITLHALFLGAEAEVRSALPVMDKAKDMFAEAVDE